MYPRQDSYQRPPPPPQNQRLQQRRQQFSPPVMGHGPGPVPGPGSVPGPVPVPMGHQQPRNMSTTSMTSVSSDPAAMKRRETADLLVKTCYDKYVMSNGNKVQETSYKSHLTIKEYSSYPSTPPPAHLPPNQIGSVKDRILVLCIRYSGRILLQKGKYNEQKRAYQIGRIWDLDELKGITRAGPNGIILSLNKDYYWKTDEGPERAWKFAKQLTHTYGSFMGKYPLLNGFSLQEFGLPPSPVKKSYSHDNSQELLNPQPDVQLMKSKSLKRKNLPNPVLPSYPSQPQSRSGSQTSFNQAPSAPQTRSASSTSHGDFYKDFDFTSNGQLPVKPMKVIDRSNDMTKSSFGDDSLDFSNDKSNDHPYKLMSPRRSEIDSHSFVFNANDEIDTDLNNDKHVSPKKLSLGPPIEGVASAHLNLEDKLTNPNDITMPASINDTNYGSDFGIEEVNDVTDDDIPKDGRQRRSILSPRRKEINSEAMGESTDLDFNDPNIDNNNIPHGNNASISSSVKEIEDFMDSQLNFGGSSKLPLRKISLNPPALSDNVLAESLDADVLDDKSFSMAENETVMTNEYTDAESELNIRKKIGGVQIEKDPEIDELLDEIQWTANDTGDSIVKKLTGELNKLKYNNVKELVNLDFSGTAMKSDLKLSLDEVENLSHIFKRMEIDFKGFDSDINTIENNSQGLQVKSVNKKLLYNDLKAILDKISVTAEDLQNIEHFRNFELFNKLEPLENQVLTLYNALETVRQDNDNESSLNSINSLKHYQANYERVAKSFILNFKTFFKYQFKSKVDLLLKEADRIYPKNVLTALSGLIIYSPLTYFIKKVSSNDFLEITAFVNQHLSELLEKMLKSKLKRVKDSTPRVPMVSSPDLQETVPLKKSRTLRFSTRKDKFINKLGLDEEKSEPSSPNTSHYTEPSGPNNETQTSDGITDIRFIIDIINDTGDLARVLQHLIGHIFHFDTGIYDLEDYLQQYPFKKRIEMLESNSVEKLEPGSYSNDLVANMNTIFGGYSNIFTKKIIPVDFNIPLILCRLETLSNDSQKSNQEFFLFNFLKKLIDRYNGIWNKAVKNRVELINKSSVVAKSGILPVIRNINHFFHEIETVLDKPSRLYGDLEESDVRSIINNSYSEITESCIHMFMRDDPLLKNNEFDDKERVYRNVSILQNIFYLNEQLSLFSNERTNKVKNQLNTVFKKVEDTYFQKILAKPIGKIIEFVNNFEALDANGRTKKYNKKNVRSLLVNFTSKDISGKAADLHKKLDRHFNSGSNMFEKDLVDKLWADIEKEYVGYFHRLDRILRDNFKGDVDYHVSKAEIHSIFRSLT